MIGRTTWWRRTGGILAALVLAVIALGPPANAAACSSEVVSVGSVSEIASSVIIGGDDGRTLPCEEGAAFCPHGHCHHAGAFILASIAVPQTETLPSVRHPLVLSRIKLFGLNFGLIRPPRA